MWQVFFIKNVAAFHYKLGQFHYKTLQVVQSASILLQNAAGITKRVDYYKTLQV